MKKKKINQLEYKIGKSEEFIQDFEILFQNYYIYIYKYEVGYVDHFNPDKPWYLRDTFYDNLLEHEMMDSPYKYSPYQYVPYIMPTLSDEQLGKLKELHQMYWDFIGKYMKIRENAETSFEEFCENMETEGDTIKVCQGY